MAGTCVRNSAVSEVLYLFSLTHSHGHFINTTIHDDLVTDVACPPAAISPGYCCPDLFMVGCSRGCLRDSGFVRQFMGLDAAAGNGLSLLIAGGGLVGCW